ncbi:MAG: tetratricopeptide repeat protein [Deltaproteobacteria bacterium]|jgi:predicted nucleic acid-binding protein|nr:tetratricopeptide repeat protein [Deltaproteobacteria bacterium]
MKVVSNTTPIISLSTIGRISLLHQLFGKIYIPREVYNELKSKKAINAFNKVLETKYSKTKTYNNLGMALSELVRYQEALEAFRKGGNEARAYNNLGCIYLEEEKFENLKKP